jgi:hypothetical protein
MYKRVEEATTTTPVFLYTQLGLLFQHRIDETPGLSRKTLGMLVEEHMRCRCRKRNSAPSS